MSFNTGGFGGFGQNNSQQSSTLGGFGSNSNTGSGFGSSNTNNAFGANAPSGGMFGNSSSGGFGTSGGFGSSSNAFGSKPAFGSTTTSSGGGLFGTSATTTGNAGFGSGFGSTNASSSTPFGSGSSLFGGSKPGFGTNTSTNTGSSLFGSGGGFGGSTGTSFGAANNPGIGTVGDPPGTGVVPYQALVEKEPTNSLQQNRFENILFMDAYKKWSAEELRLADYAKGQRTGTTGGTGAFGTSSFGGTTFGSTPQNTAFGSTSTAPGGLFGSNQPASSGFGSTATNTGGFGSGGSLFGQNKPATTSGLFGSTSQPTQSGGLFGSGSAPFGGTTATGGAFSSANTGTGGGLFGSSSSQNKPPAFSFGTGSGTTGGGFGNTGTSNAFGSTAGTANTGGGLFGNTGQASGGGGLFGNAGQQGSTGAFGGGGFGSQGQSAGSSLFGSQQKPSLFGTSNTTTTGGGLFGSTNTSSTPFGTSNTNQSTGGGLFGSKPSTTSSTLFGGTNTAQPGTSGGGLFGNLGSSTQAQQNSGSSIFGSLGQNQQQKPSLFPVSTQPTGGGLFGTPSNQQSTGLFGAGSGQQQPQMSGLGSSIFGASQNAQSTPQSLSTSINDVSAYGPLFSNLPSSEVANPGPLATPLSGSKSKTRSRSILPMYKLSPANSPAFVTPQKRGYGFSYSTYGTPTSPSSVASTPGKLGQSLMLGSISRGLNKSISASNLRRSFNVEDSILSPGAFSASSGSRYYGSTGSHKKLVINREMRSDLFTSPSKEKQGLDSVNGSLKLAKRVSFDTSIVGTAENGTGDSGRQSPEDSSSSAQEMGYLRPPTRAVNGSNSTKPGSAPATPEVDQVKGNELAIVHEEESPASARRVANPGLDREAGEYWMEPSREEIESMNRMQRQKVADFTVGRENVGSVRFKVPVDLSNINLDELFGGIVDLVIRQATVYPNPAKKPPVGKGLNVPALISLEQSWPRDRNKRKIEDVSGTRFNRHIEKLKKIPDTTFVSYDKDTGVWTFSVEHFTTYGLDDDDDYEDETGTDAEAQGVAHEIPLAIPHPPITAVGTKTVPLDTEPDDTFEFRRKRRAVPGAFDGGDSSDDDQIVGATRKSSFLSDRVVSDIAARDTKAAVEADGADAAYEAGNAEVSGLSPNYQADVDLRDVSPNLGSLPDAQQTPGGIMRARMRALKESTLPRKIQVASGDDWTETLQKSVSSRRRADRAALKALSESVVGAELDEKPREAFRPSAGESLEASNKRVVSDGHGFATSIDLMNSLFEKAKAPGPRVQASPARGFLKWPYNRQVKESDEAGMDLAEKAYRKSIRPSWGPDGTLVYGNYSTAPSRSAGKDDGFPFFTVSTISDASQQQFIRVVRLAEPGQAKATSKALQAQTALREMTLVNGVPTTAVQPAPSLKGYFSEQNVHGPAGVHEKSVWELASILFDDIPSTPGAYTGLEGEVQPRRAALSSFWEKLVEEDCTRSVAMARSNEEKAIACLAGHRVEEACRYLLEGKNFRLATLVALIGSNDEINRDLVEQMRDWKESNAVPEMSEPIRAIYELLGGNVCLCTGKQGVPIENRAESFIISQRFRLSWRQAFGLRLWYGIATGDDISAAVDSFRKDIEQRREPRPQPWFLEQGIPTAWDDPRQAEREDILWGLLKLSADRDVDLESVLEPENVSASPFDSRLSWQLGRALLATGKVSFSQQRADAATISFAEQLTAEGHWMLAIWAFSHLSSPSRARAIQGHFGRYAGRLCKDPSAWKELRARPWLPKVWAYEALALYVRSVEEDCVMELEFLRKAGNYREAHRTLVTKVGPQAIIERDYNLLGMVDLLEKHTTEIPEWNLGGAMYWAYRQLRLNLKKGVRVDLLEQLLTTLKELKKQDLDMEVRERAALHLMAAQLAEVRQDCIRIQA